ncbi:MAG: dTDP-4-dehydrorhamnose 3,5-epimerase [Planctomycetaceae bacterium]|nr:dTDP-4-dehydrorhamnose 3,5-epimerase [Planctomycetaceae bacterium]
MQITHPPLTGLVQIEPRVFADTRGFFLETFQAPRFQEAGLPTTWVQDNVSRSQRGTIRGLHYQHRQPQGKLVYVIRGAIWDVAVDLRKSSPTFGQHYGVELNDENHRQLYIPPGFAHGFCALSDTADIFYKCTALYQPGDERTLLWSDPALCIDWPAITPRLLSPKDELGKLLRDADVYD